MSDRRRRDDRARNRQQGGQQRGVETSQEQTSEKQSRTQGGNRPPSQGAPPPQSQERQSERSFQRRNSGLTCHRDSDSATAVCGDCGIPVCTEHQNEITDPVFGHFERSTSPAVLTAILVVALPVGWVLVDPISLLEQEDVSVPSGLGTTLLHSAFILGLASGFTVWVQGAHQKTSARFLRLAPPERVLCEECHASSAIQRFVYAVVVLAGVGLGLLGLYLAWDGSTISPLRVTALGVGLFVIRMDLTMFLSKIIE